MRYLKINGKEANNLPFAAEIEQEIYISARTALEVVPSLAKEGHKWDIGYDPIEKVIILAEKRIPVQILSNGTELVKLKDLKAAGLLDYSNNGGELLFKPAQKRKKR